MVKKIIFPLMVLFMLTACTTPSATVDISPLITLPLRDPGLKGITISITGADQRTDQALAQVISDNRIVTLTASRDLRYLLQEALEKQMSARGYKIGPNGAVNLQVIVKQLYADVSQGSVRYNITTKASVSVIASTADGKKMSKNYHASYSAKGAFQASNNTIANVINTVLTDIIASMAQDSSIHDFIRQNSR